VELTGDYTDDAGQLANVKTYLAELDRLDFTADQTGLVPPLPADTPAEYRIAGNATCVDCHQRDDQLWKASRHAKAWEDLKQMGRQVDPYCQQCHTTGYGLPGGFISVGKSLNLVGVGCENCHGPSQSHVENPDIKTSFDAKDQCVRCHDRENSPKFGYDHYWEKIKHGETPGTQPARPTTSATAKDTNS
jgi:mono/diheme cytochrome c family protein